MSDHDHPDHQDFSPVEEESSFDEASSPRRAASAEFVVDATVGSDVAIREAMDPANQSLGDALRLSFRVLQLVMIVLVVLFFTSGFQTVDSTQSGVFTRFGSIVPIGGNEALESGLQPTFWPYPIGEFILVDVENRSVDLGDTFWPHVPGMTLEEATEKASVHNILRPGRDGSLITKDGDLVHIRLTAQYEIDDPVRFLQNVPESVVDDVPDRTARAVLPEDAANKLVLVSLERAAVRVAAALSLQDMIEPDEDTRYQIKRLVQELLDQIGCGIRITTINIPQTTAPLAIRKAFGELQRARSDAQTRIEQAGARAERELLAAAGNNYQTLLTLINTYQTQVDTDQPDAAAQTLLAINEALESDATSGAASRILSRAKSYASQIESTLGSEARRFESVQKIYEKNPQLVIKQRWLEAYSAVLTQNDSEVFFVPPGMNSLSMVINGLAEVADRRRQKKLDFKQDQASGGMEEIIQDYRHLNASDLDLDGPGRQFEKGEDGELRSKRARD